MRINFDPHSNALYIYLHDSTTVESEEVSPGVICDFDDRNKLVGIEILAVKQRTPEELKSINFPFEEEDRIQLQQLFTISGSLVPA
jgi:uncharacterized protein YuzE